MPAGPGAVDANGVYRHGESDSASPFSDMLGITEASISVRIGQLQAAINGLQTASDAPWGTYTPTLTASITNPALGTGSTASGKFKVTDKVCQGWGQITAGSAGTTAGSGTYRFSLPVTPVGAVFVAGVAVLFDASTSTRYVGALQLDVSGPLTFAVMTFNGMTTEWGSAGGPIVLSTSDFIRVSYVYEAL